MSEYVEIFLFSLAEFIVAELQNGYIAFCSNAEIYDESELYPLSTAAFCRHHRGQRPIQFRHLEFRK